jgi:hypothetical protein
MNSITKEAYLQLNEKVGIEVKYTNYPDDEMVVLESMKQTRGELIDLFEWLNDKMELEIARMASRRFVTYDNLYQIIEEEISKIGE